MAFSSIWTFLLFKLRYLDCASNYHVDVLKVPFGVWDPSAYTSGKVVNL